MFVVCHMCHSVILCWSREFFWDIVWFKGCCVISYRNKCQKRKVLQLQIWKLPQSNFQQWKSNHSINWINIFNFVVIYLPHIIKICVFDTFMAILHMLPHHTPTKITSIIAFMCILPHNKCDINVYHTGCFEIIKFCFSFVLN